MADFVILSLEKTKEIVPTPASPPSGISTLGFGLSLILGGMIHLFFEFLLFLSFIILNFQQACSVLDASSNQSRIEKSPIKAPKQA